MRLIASHAVIEHLSCQLNVKHLPFHIHIQLPVQLLSFQQDWRQKIRTATGARASPPQGQAFHSAPAFTPVGRKLFESRSNQKVIHRFFLF